MRRALGIATAVLLLLAASLVAQAPPIIPPEKPKPPAPTTLEEHEKYVRTLAETGKLTDDLVAAFKDYAFARMKADLGSRLDADFWTWLAAQKVIREALVVEMLPKFDAAVLQSLAELHKEFAVEVDERPHLAVAFALVFGRAGRGGPWGPGGRYLRGERKAPSMGESWAWYVKHEKYMKFSLKKTSWPLLSYLADNETPLDERTWALVNYAKASDSKLANIYYEPKYDWGKLEGKPALGDNPPTLLNIRTYGGVCVDRAYFSSRVYKSMGIPAMSVDGEGRRGGHAWVAWIAKQKGVNALMSVGRFFYDKYYVGTTWYPPERANTLDREVELVAAAVGRDYDEYLAARIGAHVYEMFTGEARAAKIRILKDAVDRNPFVAKPWRLLIDACVEGLVDQDEAEKLFDTLFKGLGNYPDLTYESLEKVLTARLKNAEETPETEVKRNLKLLSRAARLYNDNKRPDLAMKLALLKGSYLEAVKRPDDALKLYVLAADEFSKEMFGFRESFDRAMRLLGGADDRKKQILFCEALLKKVPRQRSSVDATMKKLNPNYVHVVTAYVKVLDDAGMKEAADRWRSELEVR